MENPIKTIIGDMQELLNDNYNFYVFGRGSQEAIDEEIDYFINAFTDLQDRIELLYKKYGYQFEKEYRRENLKRLDETENPGYTASEELEKKVKGLSQALNWFIEYGSEDVCKLCVHNEEADKEWQEKHIDIPEDVEPCKFKRSSGTDACFCGIIEFFNNGGVKN